MTLTIFHGLIFIVEQVEWDLDHPQGARAVAAASALALS
mgnify:CR=1 FL=1